MSYEKAVLHTSKTQLLKKLQVVYVRLIDQLVEMVVKFTKGRLKVLCGYSGLLYMFRYYCAICSQ